MANPYRGHRSPSPIAQLLQTLGMTREDLSRRSEQMRQFLTMDAPTSSTATAHHPNRSSSTSSITRSHGGSRPTSVSNALRRARSPIPPTTPVKLEPEEGALPSRPMDTMEMVLERLDRKRRRANSNAPSRDTQRDPVPERSAESPSATPQTTPVTPHHYRYYSERVIGEATIAQSLPVTPREDDLSASEVTQRATHDHLAFTASRPTLNYPETPAGRHIYSSSAHLSSSPTSSPARVVNLVSSPGPMRQTPLPGDEQDDLPFVLPPGPYLTEKPDFSYAAIIGQAIVSSPQHRLTLQDIYEWIATVYPYYKRGEQTWMNSVRHALSTMAVFRKVPRLRTEGKSLWAVWDCDLECFANGGFRKSFCADMQNDRSKQTSKKRNATEDTQAKKSKRRKKSKDAEVSALAPLPAMQPAPALPPFFPAFQPNPHHQPYYQAYRSQPIPAEVIFPPLPASSNYHQVIAHSDVSRSQSVESLAGDGLPQGELEEGCEPVGCGRDSSPKPISSSSSIPDLTPNCSSASSPLPSSSFSRGSLSPPRRRHIDFADSMEDVEDTDAGSDWMGVGPSVDALEPGFTLLSRYLGTNTKSARNELPDGFSSPPRLASPTPIRRRKNGKQVESSRAAVTSPPAESSAGLCTPPRKHVASDSGLQISPFTTPLSHMGLHMSPSPSLAHYKSHLEPPPVAVYPRQAPLINVSADREVSPSPIVHSGNVHTPYRKRTSAPDFLLPVTPKRLTFSTPTSDSPFRTPSRSILDPHHPSVLIEEELTRLGTQGSPEYSTLFGKSSSLLYESPGSGRSPANWGNLFS